MPQLFDVVYACECTSTHHKLAMDALRQLECPNADKWQALFVHYFDSYLDGSKAPDKKFKDFRNHVLHVGDNYWGGAIEAARPWYEKTVHMLKTKQWPHAVYAAGVLSHYYTDPIQPMHTGQSETEGKVHRAMEWSITKSYDELRAILIDDLGGYPKVQAPTSEDWLAEMITSGAEMAHPYYDLLIDHYDLAKGVKDPSAGLDQESKDCLARLIGYAASGFARILEKAFEEAAVEPPSSRGNGLLAYLAQLTIPISWVTRKLVDRKDRAVVTKIYQEVQKTGRAIRSLPADDREIRELHAKEVLNVSLEQLAEQPVRETGAKHGEGAPSRGVPSRRVPSRGAPSRGASPRSARQGDENPRGNREKRAKRKQRPSLAQAVQTPVLRRTGSPPDAARESAADESPSRERKSGGEGGERELRVNASDTDQGGLRFHLQSQDPVVDAPSIGSKTAKRLAAVGIRTVADLLAADPKATAAKVRHGYIDTDTIKRWQREAQLALRVPNLRGHDAQLLVGCEVEAPEEIALFDANELFDLVLPFATSTEGQRILRSSSCPDLEEISNWIEWAGQARGLNAA